MKTDLKKRENEFMKTSRKIIFQLTAVMLLALQIACAKPASATKTMESASDSVSPAISALVATPEPTATPEPAETPETLEQLQADLATASSPLSTESRYAGGDYYYLMQGANYEMVLIRFSRSLESKVLYRGGLNMKFTVLNGTVYIEDGYRFNGLMQITRDGEESPISAIDPLGDSARSWYYATERYQYVLEPHNVSWGQIFRVPNDPADADANHFNTGDQNQARCLGLTDLEEHVYGFIPYNGFLYYSSKADGEEDFSLWRVLPDGSGREKVCGGLRGSKLCVDDDGRLYCMTTTSVHTDVSNAAYNAPGRQYLEPDGTLTAADYTAVYPIGEDAEYLYYDGGFMQVRVKNNGELLATKHENARGYRVSKATGEKDLTYGVSLYQYTPVGDYLFNHYDALMIPKTGGEPVALPGSKEIRLEIERYARVPSVLIDGEGSVKLELSGSITYAVYYLLYRSDDVTPGHEVRAVYLNHVNDGAMYFSPGNYVLKIARGDYWINDEEGFGESGAYSKSVATEMTAGVYTISESIASGFGSDSWGGLG